MGLELNPVFTDATGEKWDTNLNITSARRLKSELEFDVFAALEDKTLLPKLATNPIFCCDVGYLVCKEQAESKGMTDEDFGRRLAGESVLDLRRALEDSITLFFSGPERELMEVLLERVRESGAEREKEARELIHGSQLQEVMNQALAQADKEKDEALRDAGLLTNGK